MVHVDDLVLAVMTIGPVNPGHVLVMPRRHAPALEDLNYAEAGRIFAVARQVAAAIRRSGVRCEGIDLFLADGEAAFQDVFHLHLHVFPRFRGDAFRIDADWSVRPSRAELDDVAAMIRAVLVAM